LEAHVEETGAAAREDEGPEVDAERPPGALPDIADESTQVLRPAAVDPAEASEAAGFRYGGCERRPGRAAGHAGVPHRMVDAEALAERRVEHRATRAGVAPPRAIAD